VILQTDHFLPQLAHLQVLRFELALKRVAQIELGAPEVLSLELDLV
jgi:hypothetical protein